MKVRIEKLCDAENGKKRISSIRQGSLIAVIGK